MFCGQPMGPISKCQDRCTCGSIVNRSSISVFITTMNGRMAEASTWKIKYFSEASVLYIFLTLDISGINDIT